MLLRAARGDASAAVEEGERCIRLRAWGSKHGVGLTEVAVGMLGYVSDMTPCLGAALASAESSLESADLHVDCTKLSWPLHGLVVSCRALFESRCCPVTLLPRLTNSLRDFGVQLMALLFRASCNGEGSPQTSHGLRSHSAFYDLKW